MYSRPGFDYVLEQNIPIEPDCNSKDSHISIKILHFERLYRTILQSKEPHNRNQTYGILLVSFPYYRDWDRVHCSVPSE